MNLINLTEKAAQHLHHLSLTLPNRRVGSAGNRAATDFFAQTVAGWGWVVDCPEFACLDWAGDGAELTAGGETFAVQSSPYSLGGSFNGPLVTASTPAELAALDMAGKILLLRGELTQEQVMPKNFPFYNPEHHQHLIKLLETGQPQAIITATARNPETAGGLYPFPLFEDGDFDLPSVYMTEEEGERLARQTGQPAALVSRARRIPATGCNVVARKGRDLPRRLVICAHIDAKINTPGAIDNAAGVVVLLLLAELLANYDGGLGVELLAMNGEDYYAASGERQYLAENADTLADIVLAVNIDAAGYRAGRTTYSLYGCPPDVAAAFESALMAQPEMTAGEPWYQSDHSVFMQNGVPAAAITSEQFMELTTHITHTPQDTPDIIDPVKLAHTALALRDLLMTLGQGL